MTATPNLKIDLMATSSLQKEAIFNEAMLSLDIIASGVVKDDLTTPPGTPTEGDAYIVKATATDAWTGWEGRIAFYYNGWRSITPSDKMKLYNKADSIFVQYASGTNTWATIPASTVAVLDDLSDVNATSPTDGQVLTFDTTSGKWISSDPTSAYDQLSELTDVDLTTPPTDGQVLVFNNTAGKWEAKTRTIITELSSLSDIDVSGRSDGQILVWDTATSKYKHQNPSFSSTVNSLGDIGDVTTTGLAAGKALVWNGAAWEPGGVPASLDGSVSIESGFSGHAGKILKLDPTELEFLWTDYDLDALDDVVITTPADDQFLRYNGTSWVNETVAVPTTLDSLTNVSVPTPVTGQVLTWNGSSWVSSNIPTQIADWKDNVDLIIDTNVNIAGGDIASGQVFQSITLTTGMRVLLIAQTSGSQNGIYVVPSSGAASRATDADVSAEVTTGMTVMATRGTYAKQLYMLTTVGNIVLGTTVIDFAPITAGGADALDDLSDVTITSAAAKHVLVFNGSEWANRLIDMDDLSSVNLGSPPTDGQALLWDTGTSKWVPGDVSNIATLGDVGDVDLTTTAPTDGQTIVWDAGTSKWLPGNVGASISTLDDVGDVDLATPPTNGQTIVWDNANSKWVPGDVGGGALPSYTGNSGKVLTVKATEDGVEWSAEAGGGNSYLGNWGRSDGSKVWSFDAGGVPPEFIWSGSGGVGSIVTQADSGGGTTKAVQFADIGNGQQNSFAIKVTVPTGGGSLVVRAKVSSESVDVFRIFVDGAQQLSHGGIDADFVEYTYAVAAGDHTILFNYIKDNSLDQGSDTAWISKISIAATVPTLTPAVGDTVRYDGSFWMCLIANPFYDPALGLTPWRFLQKDIDEAPLTIKRNVVTISDQGEAVLRPVIGNSGGTRTPFSSKWRLYFNSNAGDPNICLTELDMRAAPGGASLMGAGTATSTGMYSAGTEGAWVDGNVGTNIWLLGNNNVWWAYEFTESVTVNEIMLHSQNGQPNGWPVSLDVQYFADGAWNTAWSISATGITGGNQEVDLAYPSYVAPTSDPIINDLAGNGGKVLTVSADATHASWEKPTTKPLTINDQTASYSLLLADVGGYVRMNSLSPMNLTVPANSAVAFDIGTAIPVRQVGAGQVTIVASSGVTVSTPETLKLRTAGSGATLIKVGTDTWDLVGDLEAA